MSSIVVTEIKASILRHRLFDRLDGRKDIVAPRDLSPGLARRIPWFLIAGLDDCRDPGTGGWPVFTGGRYQKLCFSPVFDVADNAEQSDGKAVPYRLPRTAADFTDYVRTITGIGQPEHDDLARLYRFDPVELFDACRAMRQDCPPAWRLVLSYSFGPALRLWPDLRDVQRMAQFHHPLIDAFRIIADLERASLIMRQGIALDADCRLFPKRGDASHATRQLDPLGNCEPVADPDLHAHLSEILSCSPVQRSDYGSVGSVSELKPPLKDRVGSRPVEPRREHAGSCYQPQRQSPLGGAGSGEHGTSSCIGDRPFDHGRKTLKLLVDRSGAFDELDRHITHRHFEAVGIALDSRGDRIDEAQHLADQVMQGFMRRHLTSLVTSFWLLLSHRVGSAPDDRFAVMRAPQLFCGLPWKLT